MRKLIEMTIKDEGSGLVLFFLILCLIKIIGGRGKLSNFAHYDQIVIKVA